MAEGKGESRTLRTANRPVYASCSRNKNPETGQNDRTKTGCLSVRFGQNFAGVPRLKVSGKAGATIVLRGGEDIHADGTLNYLTVIAGQLKAMWNMNGGPGCPDDGEYIHSEW